MDRLCCGAIELIQHGIIAVCVICCSKRIRSRGDSKHFKSHVQCSREGI